MIRLAAIFYAGMIAVALAINGIRGAMLVPLDWERHFLPALAAGLLCGALTISFSRYGRARWEWVRRLETTFRQALGPLELRQVLFLALASGTAEELLFRGALQPALVRLLGSPVSGLLVTTAAFALLHTGPDRSLRAWTGFAFVLGLLLGTLTMACGNIIPATACHVLVNAVNLRRIARPIGREAGD